jgi:hypothetical protein
MGALLELIEGVVELWCSWRFYLCLAIGVGCAIILHRAIPDVGWVWFLSIPFAVASVVVGWFWQRAADLEGS